MELFAFRKIFVAIVFPAHYYIDKKIAVEKLLVTTRVLICEFHKRSFVVKMVTSDMGGLNKAIWRNAGIIAIW